MKRAFLLILLILMLFPSQGYAANDAEVDEEARRIITEGIDETLSGLELEEFSDIYAENAVFGDSFEDAIKRISEEGLTELTAEQALDIIKEEAFSAFRTKLGLAVQIVIILAVMSVLTHFEKGFKTAGAARASSFAGYTLTALMALTMLLNTFNTARGALTDMSNVTNTLTPLLTALLTGLGNSSSQAVMSPIMSTLTGSVFALIENIVFPVIVVMTVLMLISNISSTLDFKGFYELGDKAVKWFLGIVFVVFIGLVAIKGIGGAALDGIYFKTAKYTVEKVVPYVGGMFSDTMDTLIACGVIVTNAVGTVGLVTLASKLIVPVISLVCDILIFKAASSIISPFGDQRSARMLSSMAKVSELLNVCVIVCAAMSFISIALLVGSADISFMMR